MKDCAYYMDHPTIDDENTMKYKLQRRYDSILPEGWRPPLYSRRDLLSWACKHHNAALQERVGGEPLPNCENPKLLVERYGPNYDNLRPKIGYIRGLFD